ncbi:helix-turn-helix domain-containing protein [Frigidibacter sp. ROC022]|uniref:helix-turn-helix domain-containing protein n=1 Tax=Frigidibacter sp. ROC022 TaxID=2971796 RepID=UPI00215A48BA|nr:AraC family transcriptional regulator [Frigidibacter sp. ROC022]MCR8725380.1 AraC family transcriptional regulator [Frigidibacter sp. ROC022]
MFRSRPFLETLVPEPGASWFFLDRRLTDGIPFEWHRHPEFELTLTLNSRGNRFVGDHVGPYDDGDLVLIGPNVPHSWRSRERLRADQPHMALVACFSPDWIGRLAETLPELSHVSELLAGCVQAVSFSPPTRQRVAERMRAMRGALPADRLILLLQALNEIARDTGAETIGTAPPPTGHLPAADPRFTRVLDHIHHHYAERLTVAALAEMACASQSSFHRMFRRHTRMTFGDYVARLRIGHACCRLIESNDPVSRIAADVGFGNLSMFNRTFARIRNCTPSGFRAAWRNGQEPGPALAAE